MSGTAPDPRHARLFALIHQQARASHVATRLQQPVPPSAKRALGETVMQRALQSWERPQAPRRP